MILGNKSDMENKRMVVKSRGESVSSKVFFIYDALLRGLEP